MGHRSTEQSGNVEPYASYDEGDGHRRRNTPQFHLERLRPLQRRLCRIAQADTLAELEPDILVLGNLEWRQAYGEDFKRFVRELGRQPVLMQLLDEWT